MGLPSRRIDSAAQNTSMRVSAHYGRPLLSP